MTFMLQAAANPVEYDALLCQCIGHAAIKSYTYMDNRDKGARSLSI